ncbi:MAG: hypothetical protein ACTHOH_15545 [Lysobacteraceae bacterium]
MRDITETRHAACRRRIGAMHVLHAFTDARRMVRTIGSRCAEAVTSGMSSCLF